MLSPKVGFEMFFQVPPPLSLVHRLCLYLCIDWRRPMYLKYNFQVLCLIFSIL